MAAGVPSRTDYHREWRAAHPDAYEKRKPYFRSYYAEHKVEMSEATKRYRLAHPERHKDQVLRHRYGIGVAEYDAMLAAQGGKCAICGEVMDPPHVDHRHADKVVRGLLCDTCNRGIGFMKESPRVLAAAITYLKEY